MSDIVYCKDCAYAEPNNLDAYHAVKLGVFCTRYRQNTAGIYGCDNGKPKPKTNADIIRNMTDEEMAKFLQEDVFYEPWCPDDVVCIIGEGCQLTDKDCGKCALKWLKQEYNE